LLPAANPAQMPAATSSKQRTSTMTKPRLVIACLLVAFVYVASTYFAPSSSQAAASSSATAADLGAPMVGNDRDSHGCIGSAGYSWCEAANQCVRPWEWKSAC
jgi:hypothetical protein